MRPFAEYILEEELTQQMTANVAPNVLRKEALNHAVASYVKAEFNPERDAFDTDKFEEKLKDLTARRDLSVHPKGLSFLQ